MEILTNKKEKRIQANDLALDNILEYRTFWRDIQSQYIGYEVDFCFHNCNIPTDFMIEIGAVLLETCVETRLLHNKFTPVYGKREGVFVTDQTFTVFKSLHDNLNPKMYWTSERISRDLNCWSIYICGDSYVLMSLWGDAPEVYALETRNSEDGAALLSAVIEFALKKGKHNILFMIDEDSRIQFEAARSVGFTICGRYIAYRCIVK